MAQKPQARNLRDVQEEYKDAVVGLCVTCEKPCKGGFYGRWGNSGTCSKKCEQVEEERPKYEHITAQGGDNATHAQVPDKQEG